MSVIQNIRLLRALDGFTKSVGKDGGLMNWLHSLAALGMAALTIFTPQIQHVIAGHPTISGVVGAFWVVWAHLSPSPVAGPPTV